VRIIKRPRKEQQRGGDGGEQPAAPPPPALSPPPEVRPGPATLSGAWGHHAVTLHLPVVGRLRLCRCCLCMC